MIDIINPQEPVYWIIKSEDGSIVHSGVVRPGQRLTSGLAEIVQMDNEEDFIIATADEGLDLTKEDSDIETPIVEDIPVSEDAITVADLLADSGYSQEQKDSAEVDSFFTVQAR